MYQDLDDIIFEDRHKAYGAYEFRKHYDSILTKALLIGVLIALFLLLIPAKLLEAPKKTAVKSEAIIPIDLSDMKINYGDNRDGKGIEEPKKEEGSPAPKVEKEENIPIPKLPKVPKEVKSKDIPENSVPTPTRTKSIPNNTRKSKEKTNVELIAKANKTNKVNTTDKAEVKKENATGDGRGNAAIGNLLRGRGTKSGTQGNGAGDGNNGDPLGGSGDGNSLIGVDRKLIGFIPGTMGRGGTQPTHDCKTSGSISIAYTVDKSGKVTTAKRIGGLSDPCVVRTAETWVKNYVKAEASSISSKGTYKIVF